MRDTRTRSISLNATQARELLAAVNRRAPFGEQRFALIVLVFHTGLRVSELVGLNVGDVATNDGQPRELLHLRAETAKGRRSRIVPLNSKARKAVAALVNFNRARGFSVAPGAPLLVNRKHKRLSVRAIQYLMEALRKKADLDVRATPHTLRHTFGTVACRKTGDVRGLQQIMGHASLVSTAVYLHPNADDLTRITSTVAGDAA